MFAERDLSAARPLWLVTETQRDAWLAAQDDALLNESVVPMFVAPPDVCKAAGTTLFYGLIPTTSSEKAEGGAPQFDDVAFGPSSADFQAHLVGPLRGLADSFRWQKRHPSSVYSLGISAAAGRMDVSPL